MPVYSYFGSHKAYLEWYRNYQKTDERREYKRVYIRNWRKKHGTYKDRIRRRLLNRVQAGLIVKKPCEQCGYAKVEAHHEDYRKPYVVIWLCRKHHRERDVLEGRR